MKEGDQVYVLILSEREERKLQTDPSVGRQDKGASSPEGREDRKRGVGLKIPRDSGGVTEERLHEE